MLGEFNVGDTVTVHAQFKVRGNLTDPTEVVVLVKPAAGPRMSRPAVRDGVGQYHADIDVDRPGIWAVRWEGTGAAKGASQDTFAVRKSI